MKQPDAPLLTPTSDSREAASQEARCHCGHLVAILRKDGVELKCKRCKRIVVLPFGSNNPKDFHLAPCSNT